MASRANSVDSFADFLTPSPAAAPSSAAAAAAASSSSAVAGQHSSLPSILPQTTNLNGSASLANRVIYIKPSVAALADGLKKRRRILQQMEEEVDKIFRESNREASSEMQVVQNISGHSQLLSESKENSNLPTQSAQNEESKDAHDTEQAEELSQPFLQGAGNSNWPSKRNRIKLIIDETCVKIEEILTLNVPPRGSSEAKLRELEYLEILKETIEATDQNIERIVKMIPSVVSQKKAQSQKDWTARAGLIFGGVALFGTLVLNVISCASSSSDDHASQENHVNSLEKIAAICSFIGLVVLGVTNRHHMHEVGHHIQSNHRH